jgi:hypothetical protein
MPCELILLIVLGFGAAATVIVMFIKRIVEIFLAIACLPFFVVFELIICPVTAEVCLCFCGDWQIVQAIEEGEGRPLTFLVIEYIWHHYHTPTKIHPNEPAAVSAEDVLHEVIVDNQAENKLPEVLVMTEFAVEVEPSNILQTVAIEVAESVDDDSDSARVSETDDECSSIIDESPSF